MRLRPFRSIFTRILNQDNIFQGLSSFAVEMSELRDILLAANQNSLVLGDELCAGTESDSAQALVASGIQWLAKKSAKFIFATHLHDIPRLLPLHDLGVAVKHIHVHYDPVTKKLVYERQLREGSGSSLYGLEVARAMNLPYEFIETALANRNKLIGEFRRTSADSSAWNSEIFKQKCEICGQAGANRPLEVHHIRQRFTAENGRLNTGEHMNHPRNLIVLCEKCHHNQHTISKTPESSEDENMTYFSSISNKDAIVSSVQLTSDGPERMTASKSSQISSQISSNIPPKKKSKTNKWSDEEIEIIQQTLLQYPKTALKQIRYLLYSHYSIDISEAMLRQFRKYN